MRAQRWAAVGTGTISRSVVPDLWNCTGAEVVIVHGRDAEKAARFAEEFSIPSSTSNYQAVLPDPSPMLREVIDAIAHGMTQHPTHSAAATLAVFRTLDAILVQIQTDPTTTLCSTTTLEDVRP